MNNQIQRFYINKLLLIFSGILLIFLSVVKAAASNDVLGKRTPIADFDGDGKSDISVFRPSDGYWYIAKSSGGYSSIKWGLGTDTPVSGDYDGDGKTDIAVFRRFFDSNAIRNNVWYILRSSDNTFRAVTWVPNTQWYYYDFPVSGDFDGDGKADLAVFRNSDAIGEAARFMVLQSLNESGTSVQWGFSGWDRSVSADYDGDGKTDVAVYRGKIFNTQVNSWFILQSSNGAVKVEPFGIPSDLFVPADYDGDGKADIAVWRPSDGYWYRINSRDNSFSSIQFGLSDDKPTPADYDGDGKTDVAVFRPSTGVWYLQRSTAGFAAQQFGSSGDVPIPNTFVR